MRAKKYGIVSMETGELIRVTPHKGIAIDEVTTTITKDMLETPSEELIKYLYKRMRVSNKIDQFGMIKLDGLYVGEDFFRIGAESGILAECFFRMKSALSIRGFIKKTPTVDCSSWKEVIEVLGIDPANKRKFGAMKKILIKEDVIREGRNPIGKKVYAVNPNILRHGTHTSDYCISIFRDVTLHKVDKFNTYLMYLNGLLNYSDVN